MKNKGIVAVLILSLVASTGYGQSKLDKHRAQAKKELEKRIETFVKDFNAGNGEGFADIFSNRFYDAAQRQAVVKNVEGVHQYYEVHYELEIDTLIVDHHMAYDKGKIVTTLTPKGAGEKITETNAYMEIWEKEADGKWRIVDAIKHKINKAPNATSDTTDVPKEWVKYLGDYYTGGTVFKILVSEDKKRLMIFLEGQLNHTLTESAKNVYSIDSAPGISVKFKEENGKIALLEFVQPTGTIIANRK
ncbi:nuclear transport factor 2 family protein [Flavobacteriaceae bacterium 3-367]